MKEIICISGKARAGKDTFATFLKDYLENHGQRTLIFHYADLVKHVATDYFRWDGNKDEDGRTLLQRIGTDIGRASNPDIWVDWAINFFRAFGVEWDYIIVPDCRFPNEINGLRDSGYISAGVRHVRIKRNLGNDLTPEQVKHASETSLDDARADLYVNNNGSLRVLDNKARDLAYTLLGAPDIWAEGNDYAEFSAKLKAIDILQCFEEFLQEKSLRITCACPMEERIRPYEMALFGEEYNSLLEAVTEALLN